MQWSCGAVSRAWPGRGVSGDTVGCNQRLTRDGPRDLCDRSRRYGDCVDLDAALSETFGFPAFRPGQREACARGLPARDVLVVMPTGSGKSLCYQLPALMGDALAIVVSPLVSLMQD